MGEPSFVAGLVNRDGITDKRFTEAQKSFWAFCVLRNPKFFRDDRPHLRELCDDLQGIYEGTLINPATGKPYRKIMINIPPRHGKSYIITLFVQWIMGRNNETRCITVSYNDILAGRFARNVRDGIDATKIDDRFVVFQDIFPGTRIKHGDASAQMWSLEGQFFSYLGTGFGGTITGIGCSIGIIDDPIKNNEEAFNSRELDAQWSWYVDTFLSRIESDEGREGIQIIIMTRWSTQDLCGRLSTSEDADEWYVHERPACLDEEKGTMLCPSILSYEAYKKKRRLMSEEIADANLQQHPVDIKGKLYSDFATYAELPKEEDGRSKFETILSYTDTADEGTDFLCSVVVGVYQGEGWVLDVIYTDKPMEVTEPDTAEQLDRCHVDTAHIESNNGGRGFARNVERLLWETHGTRSVDVQWFHQSANKHARILSNATFVTKHLYFPENWPKRWPQFYAAMNAYQKAGGNKHDDAPDAVTGIAEKIQALSDAPEGDIWWC